MSEKKPKPKKPKNYAKLSQKQKFIAAAREAGTDETGETFLRAVRKITSKRVLSPRKAKGSAK